MYILKYVAFVLIIIAISADWVGIGNHGFGYMQQGLAVTGVVLFVMGSIFHRVNKKINKKISGHVFIIVTEIIITFLLVDFISVYFLPHRRSPVERRFPVQTVRQPKPYVMFGGAEYGKLNSGESLNYLGYRGKLPSPIKKPDEFRIFLLGGSTVFKGNPSIPTLLGELFKRSGFKNVGVYNFGVVSSGSGQGISRILFEISEFNPDLIVMYNGNNDILHPYIWDPQPGYPFNFIAYKSNPLLESDIRSYPRATLFLYGSNLVRYFFPSWFVRRFIPLEKVRKEVKYKSEEWKNNIAKIYVKNLIKADKISKVFGAEFIAFFQPTIYFKDTLSAEEEQMKFPVKKDYYINMRRKILFEIEIAQRNEDIAIVDLTDIYDDVSETVFKDLCHTRQEAKLIVAQNIFKHILNYFKINK